MKILIFILCPLFFSCGYGDKTSNMIINSKTINLIVEDCLVDSSTGGAPDTYRLSIVFKDANDYSQQFNTIGFSVTATDEATLLSVGSHPAQGTVADAIHNMLSVSTYSYNLLTEAQLEIEFTELTITNNSFTGSGHVKIKQVINNILPDIEDNYPIQNIYFECSNGQISS